MRPWTPNDPSQVGPFRTVAVLGQGGMGRVLLGVAADGRLVAVKQVHDDLADDEGFRSRFRREVDASRRVSGAYTAPVVDADPDAATPWLASLFLPGLALNEVLAAGVLPEAPVRQVAAGLAQALADIHRVGLVHRDLKPSNVMLTDDGVRVIDFGIARAADHLTKLTHTGALIGSPAFMAPEQIRGETPGPAADIFALGATLVVACTGKTPFAGTSAPGLMYSIAHEEPDLDAVPPHLRGLLAACLAKDPAQRPSPRELLALIGPVPPSARPWPEAVHGRIAEQRAEIDRLVRAAVATAPAPRAAPVPLPRARGRGRRRWTVAAVTAGVLAVTGAVGAATGLAGDLYYTFVDEPVPTPGNVPLSQVADKYTGALPSCAEAGAAMRLPAGFVPERVQDGGPPTGQKDGGSSNQCAWNTRSGDRVVLVWELFRGKAGGPTGAELAKTDHEGMYIRGDTHRVFALGFVEEALWYKPDGRYCVLYARDVNLDLFVQVKGPNHPLGTCEALTEDSAKQAVALAATQAAAR
ncbi:serine/threonine-protein kinase [Streptomyces sp. NPDC058326]|uniref:serine/threonine-protein kinase n=1 Tax=Streptomyces sp. NPDC058326 TaxID=3346447 RepID=UPI0036E1ECEB